MSQSEIFTSVDKAEIEDIGSGLKRQMLGHNTNLWPLKFSSKKALLVITTHTDILR